MLYKNESSGFKDEYNQLLSKLGVRSGIIELAGESGVCKGLDSTTTHCSRILQPVDIPYA